MSKNFGAPDWKAYLPIPVFEEHPEYEELYNKAWELAFDHIKDIPGMPQTPYMDEAFCATQLWIWDTCFMSLFCKYAREVFPGVESLQNFYALLYEGKHFPPVIVPEDEPGWTGAVPGEPFEINLCIADNPPLFAWVEYENALFSGDKESVKELLYERGVLQKHYDWIENLHEPVKMDSWLVPTFLTAETYGYKWEGGSSGMDNTPRGRTGEHATEERPNNPDMLWLDALCQQALSAHMIAKLYGIVGDEREKERWNQKYEEKKRIINDLYWDDQDQFYYDIDCGTHEFYRVMTIASYWTMTSETAGRERAKKLVERASDPKTFGGAVPLVSLSRSDSDYSPDGKYWRGSMWLPAAYAALKGFALYGYFDAAHTAAAKILEHMYRTYIDYTPHTIWECYSPEEHKPGTQTQGETVVRKDFCGWSALGPISIYLEFVLGFHTADAFTKTVQWAMPGGVSGKIGIRNLRFGTITTDIVADGNVCTAVSNEAYTLEINGRRFEVAPGENHFSL
ncbi:MAG: trehalase family glycosidase [Firmicutes bacterium]|nr:trehalase family glycosidase [Bacillota bacterium]